MQEDSYVKYRVVRTRPGWPWPVKTLHDSIINITPPRGAPLKGPKPDSIHITAVNIPTVYTAVLETVPKLHAAPPVPVPEYTPPTSRAPPEEGYDLIVHVGVAGPGPLRAERLAHKTGYALPDYERQSPPLIIGAKGNLRGFGLPRYGEEFGDELFTAVDVDSFVGDLTTGPNPLPLEPSNDAGRFVCDFTYYCSLAESRIAKRETPVLFIHCPPIGQPMSTPEVADGVRRIISNVCGKL
ncbi:hypothetical protein FB45DRAFT_907440 [Roridomyces roridus]|uniref:Peptidase C15, pyroglutamyl peptidase I-like protein n=1 Tax=Roridomyces roridus TaxID=1738132 RepID=A0AAD7C230_9AGAR|nr:hypothetical protein FB45DRAFT_907440 [Roridomyces roridus]